MKKLALLISMSILTLTSCNDDDKNETVNSDASIVGVWKMDKYQLISGKDSSVLEEIIKKNECERKSTYEFTAGNKFITKIFIEFDGKCIEDGSNTKEYFYNKNDKTLTLNSENEAAAVKILTSSSLVFEAPERDINKDGVKDFSIAYFSR